MLLSLQRICRRQNFWSRIFHFVGNVEKKELAVKCQYWSLYVRKSGKRCRWYSEWRPNDRYSYHRRIRSPSIDMECIRSPIQSQDISMRFSKNLRFSVQFLVTFFRLDFVYVVLKGKTKVLSKHQLHILSFFFPVTCGQNQFWCFLKYAR